jgi:hypothetical protein
MSPPREKVLDAALALRSVLKEHGRLLLSIPLARPGLDTQNRDPHGRLFTPLDPDYLQLLFERLGLQMVDRWESEDALNRKGHDWCTLLFHLSQTAAVRPIDEIASVLSRDRKTATYKRALFRALSEIAVTGFEQARWGGARTVGIPLDIVCEKWLLYYWSLFASKRFVPQIRGESEQSQMGGAYLGDSQRAG